MSLPDLNLWIRSRDLDDATKLNLFCLPHAGSGAAGFYRWRRLLDDVNVCPILLPGRDVRMDEEPFTDAAALVTAMHCAMGPLLDRPYAIFGHSTGALLGALWTLMIQRDGLRLPEWLILSGRGAPGSEWKFEYEELSDRELFQAIDQRYQGQGSSLILEDEVLRSYFAKLLRADLSVNGSGAALFTQPMQAKVCAVVGDRDPAVVAASVERWSDFVANEFVHQTLPGGHFYHFDEGQTELLALLRRLLVRPQST